MAHPEHPSACVDPKQYGAKTKAIRRHTTANAKRAHHITVAVACIMGGLASYNIVMIAYYALRHGEEYLEITMPAAIALLALFAVSAGLVLHRHWAHRASTPALAIIAIFGLIGQYIAPSALFAAAGWLTLLAAGTGLYLLSDTSVRRLFQ